jgi:hypothetical protein
MIELTHCLSSVLDFAGDVALFAADAASPHVEARHDLHRCLLHVPCRNSQCQWNWMFAHSSIHATGQFAQMGRTRGHSNKPPLTLSGKVFDALSSHDWLNVRLMYFWQRCRPLVSFSDFNVATKWTCCT